MKTDEEDIRYEIELLIDDCRGALHEVEGNVGSHRALMYVDDLTHSAERLSALLYQLTTKAKGILTDG